MKTDTLEVVVDSKVRSAVRNPELEFSFEIVEAGEVNERTPSGQTSAERRELAIWCHHGNARTLCVECAGLTAGEIARWNDLRTTEQFIHRCGMSLHGWTSVKISSNDCVLTFRAEKRPVVTQDTPVAFQRSQFSREVGAGAKEKDYAGSQPVRRQPRSDEGITARGLFLDPLSRFTGGVGYLRQPLDASRETRTDAPDWFDSRTDFFATLRPTRADRAEQIFTAFYLEDKTDTQIAEAVGWTKDSVKKERADLIRRGNRFFEAAEAKHPPSPAVFEEVCKR